MKYDAIIIGSGQGGNPLAHKLADQGWSVALVEERHLGNARIGTSTPAVGAADMLRHDEHRRRERVLAKQWRGHRAS